MAFTVESKSESKQIVPAEQKQSKRSREDEKETNLLDLDFQTQSEPKRVKIAKAWFADKVDTIMFQVQNLDEDDYLKYTKVFHVKYQSLKKYNYHATKTRTMATGTESKIGACLTRIQDDVEQLRDYYCVIHAQEKYSTEREEQDIADEKAANAKEDKEEEEARAQREHNKLFR